jgi:hypothetical protein
MDTEGSDDDYHPTNAIMIDISDTRLDIPDTEIIVGDQGSENLLFSNNLRSRLNTGGDGDGGNNESKSDLSESLSSVLNFTVLLFLKSAHGFTYSDPRATYATVMLILSSTSRKTAIPIIEILSKLHETIPVQGS